MTKCYKGSLKSQEVWGLGPSGRSHTTFYPADQSCVSCLEPNVTSLFPNLIIRFRGLSMTETPTITFLCLNLDPVRNVEMQREVRPEMLQWRLSKSAADGTTNWAAGTKSAPKDLRWERVGWDSGSNVRGGCDGFFSTFYITNLIPHFQKGSRWPSEITVTSNKDRCLLVSTLLETFGRVNILIKYRTKI